MSATVERLVIVGASLAGLRAAQAARKAGFAGSLVVIGDEPHMPYTRPPLSKDLLAGEQEPEQVALRAGDLDADWRLGSAATALDRAAKRVQLANGDSVEYDRLIIATGCRARSWSGPGADLTGVHTLRGLDDALALTAALTPGSRLVIVGAGFIGCEVAASARKLGAEVTVLDIAPHPMLPLGPELGARCARMHEAHGVVVRCEVSIESIAGDGAVRAVVLAGGEEIPADAVLLALGAQPNVEWLAGSGLDIDSGVACDATLTTTVDPDILAAGDIASWPHPMAGKTVRVEHWTVANEHGQAAGQNVLLDPAEREPHIEPPYFWSDQFDTKIQAVGWPALADRLEIVEEEPEAGRLLATGERDGRVIGVVAFNNARRLMGYRAELAEQLKAGG
jgi:NADPH-dependent 2,4-dienoyl-CoA reductase/sulfur reductase-like enzyme